MKVKVQEGKTYFLCSCSLSDKYPFCNGAHKGSGKRPVQFKAEKDGMIEFLNNEEIVEA